MAFREDCKHIYRLTTGSLVSRERQRGCQIKGRIAYFQCTSCIVYKLTAKAALVDECRRVLLMAPPYDPDCYRTGECVGCPRYDESTKTCNSPYEQARDALLKKLDALEGDGG